jgi:hypothetical protein
MSVTVIKISVSKYVQQSLGSEPDRREIHVFKTTQHLYLSWTGIYSPQQHTLLPLIYVFISLFHLYPGLQFRLSPKFCIFHLSHVDYLSSYAIVMDVIILVGLTVCDINAVKSKCYSFWILHCGYRIITTTNRHLSWKLFPKLLSDFRQTNQCVTFAHLKICK